MRQTPEYQAWLHMRDRCEDPTKKEYPNYGGRGIVIHAAWQDFAEFFAHIGLRPSPKHSVDRIDVNGNYEPGNVRWATPDIQANNKRNNLRHDWGGESMTLSQIARLCGLKYNDLHHAIYRKGMDVKAAVDFLQSNQSDVEDCFQSVKLVSSPMPGP